MKKKKAYLVDYSFRVRIIVDEDVDPEIDPEFDIAADRKLRVLLREDILGDNIVGWEEDTECPYDPEIDN